MPKRFHHQRGAFKPPGTWIVTRPSKFGNPFRLTLREYGDPAAAHPGSSSGAQRAETARRAL